MQQKYCQFIYQTIFKSSECYSMNMRDQRCFCQQVVFVFHNNYNIYELNTFSINTNQNNESIYPHWVLCLGVVIIMKHIRLTPSFVGPYDHFRIQLIDLLLRHIIEYTQLLNARLLFNDTNCTTHFVLKVRSIRLRKSEEVMMYLVYHIIPYIRRGLLMRMCMKYTIITLRMRNDGVYHHC